MKRSREIVACLEDSGGQRGISVQGDQLYSKWFISFQTGMMAISIIHGPKAVLSTPDCSKITEPQLQ